MKNSFLNNRALALAFCPACVLIFGGFTLRAQLANPPPDGASCDYMWRSDWGYVWVCSWPSPPDAQPTCPSSGTSGGGGPPSGPATGGTGPSTTRSSTGVGAPVATPVCTTCGGNGGPGGPGGGGNPNSPQCCPNSSPSAAMPSWTVSEPSLKLLFQDLPFFYNTSRGRQLALELHNKQDPGPHGRIDNSQPAIYSVGTNWHTSWRSYIQPLLENTNGSVSSNSYLVFPGDGSARQHVVCRTGDNYNDPSSGARLTHNTADTDQYELLYPDGTKNIYSQWVAIGDQNYCMLTRKEDGRGGVVQFVYAVTNAGNYRTVRLAKMIDPDGLETTLIYTNHSYYSNLLTEVRGPYGLTNLFKYDSGAHLTNITDVAGIASQLYYDSQERVTKLLTPYGTNTFTYLTNSSGWRALLIDELGIRQNLYLAGYDGSGVFSGAETESSSLATFLADNSLLPHNLESSGFDQQNTFYWAPRQYQHLSSSIRTSLTNGTFDPANLTTSDLRLGWTRHWLTYSGTNTLSEVLSIERSPSPSDDGSTEGLLTWYDYTGKGGSGPNAMTGTTVRQPRLKAQRTPGGDWHVIQSAHNRFGKPTEVKENYSSFEIGWDWYDIYIDGGFTTGWRTDLYTYAADGPGAGLNLISHRLRYYDYYNVQIDMLKEGYAYNSLSQVTYATNALEEVTSYTYNSSNRLETVTTSAGLVTTYSYDSNGMVANVIQSSATQSFSTNQYTYTNGLVYTHANPRGLTVTNVWDPLGRLLKSFHVDGNAVVGVTNVYDKLDLVRTYDPLGFTNDYRYNELRELLYHTNANRKVTSYQYCNCGALDNVTDSLGQTTSQTYDNAGRLVRTTLPGGTWRENSYNRLGQVAVVTDSAGLSLTNDYTIDGRLWRTRSAEGISTLTHHDGAGRPNLTVDGNGVRTLLVTDALGRVTRRHYIESPYGYEVLPSPADEWFTYGPGGLIATTNRDGKVTLFGYDELGRKVAETNANNEVTLFSYNAAGDLLTLTDAKSQVTTWKYDVEGRVTNKLDAASNESFRYTYDANSRLASRWTPGSGGAGLLTQYSYDANGSLTFVNYPNSPDVTLQYDDGNRLINMLDAAGQTRYAYTSFGAVQSEDGPWDNDIVSYGYDNGRRYNSLSLLQPNTGAWSQSYLNDTLGRLTNVASPAGVFGTTLYRPKINPDTGAPDASGLPVAGTTTHWMSLPGGANLTNTFDVDGRLLSTTLLDAGRTALNSHSYVYSDAGLRTRQSRLDGSYVDYGYDNAGQLTSAAAPWRLHEQFSYTYDPAGNLTNRVNYALQQEFRVNDRNEITQVNRSGTLVVAGGVQGNASSVTVNGVAASVYSDKTFAKDGFSVADGSNTFTAVATDSYSRWATNTVNAYLPASASYVYDLNGNLRTDGRRHFTYDDENQLTAVVVTNATRSEFTYDGRMRRRVRKEYIWTSGSWILASECRYVYDGNLVIQERDGMNLPQVTYTRGRDLSGSLESAGGIGGLLARTDNRLSLLGNPAAHTLYHCDGNGNVTMLINLSGQIAARYLYDPFGNLLAATGPLAEANLYRFSSKELHAASGLVYYLYRFYEPGLQRWVNRDPIAEPGFRLCKALESRSTSVRVMAQQKRSSSLYVFVLNMPSGLIDALGLNFGNPVPTCLCMKKSQKFVCDVFFWETAGYPDPQTCLAEELKAHAKDQIQIALAASIVVAAANKACKVAAAVGGAGVGIIFEELCNSCMSGHNEDVILPIHVQY